MILCFGTFANILMLCSLPKTTNKEMVSALVSTIDTENKYGDKYNATAISKLMNCQRNFPSAESSPGNGAVIDNGGSITNIFSLAKSISTATLSSRFTPVVNLLDEDKKRAAVGLLHYLIKEDDSLAGNHSALFVKCVGDTATHVVESKEVDLCYFLAGIFLYTVLTNENTKGKPYIQDIRNKDLFQRFSAYEVTFRKTATASENYAISEASSGVSDGEILDGITSYLERLSDKCNRIPSILFKDALTPFRDFYVPNDVVCHEPIPGNRNSYNDRIIKGADVASILGVSHYLVLSGTGGLGKSMMMRSFALSSIERYNDIGLIPFFIPLRDYEISYPSMVEYIFATVVNLWPELSTDRLEAILKTGKALLLFDGLDEIHTSNLRDFTTKMNAFQDRYSQNAFVISSRPYSNFQSFTRSTVLNLLSFSKAQALELVDRYNYRADAPRLQAKFRSQLDSELYYTHRGFSDNPLLLSIMMLTFEMDAEVPTVKYLFYQEAYTVLSRRHDAIKNGYSRSLATGWNANRFSDYFAFFCAVTYSEGKISFTYNMMEQYFRMLTKKYNIANVTVDDFIFDLTNNLCLMYLDGLNYSFIHRSFQEYFCAKYFNAQLDELLTQVIPIFDRDDTTKKGDSAIEMLYDMKPKAVEKYLIIPYLRSLIDECEKDEGIWTFLDRLYDNYVLADGVAEADEDECKPHSNLYSFILAHYKIPLASPSVEDFPGVDFFIKGTIVYREDTNEDDWEENLPFDYEEMYGEPEVTGHLYAIPWKRARGDSTKYPDLLEGFIPAVESPENPFMKEYNEIKRLLSRLEKTVREQPSTSNIFDLME